METVRSSGDALLVVINDILDFSKIEAGELHLEHQAFSLRSCAESSLDMIAQHAASKGLDLVLDVAEDCPGHVIGDASRLRQVLVNLLSNGVKFTDSGEVLLTVATAGSTPEGTILHFSVRDSGIGIPVDRMDLLFRSFSQVDASTTRVYGGTGLGLAISRGLVRAMGGDLQVESVCGQGSTFAFTVPLGISSRPEPTGAIPVERLAGRSVLIVDDNATILRVLNLQLSGWGLQTTCASGPQEAIDLVAGGARFEAAILDMHMPVMDGEGLAAALRALPGGRAMPLVMLRSLGPLPAPRSGAVFSSVLTKPVKVGALKGALLTAFFRDASDIPAQAAGTPAAEERAQQPRILLAEDNAVNQKVAQLMLDRLGYDVDTVGNGAEAVAALDAKPYRLVLMDIHMPQMDGLEATRTIRTTLPRDRQPRIVALTASALMEDRKACEAAGVDDFLVKPFRQEQLRAVLG